jgi:hypothetical protein
MSIIRFGPLQLSKAHSRELADLKSVGPATLRDFEQLDIRSVLELARQDPVRLYEELCHRTGVRQDPCVMDVLTCAIAQARDPKLPAAQCNWWYWSRKRKSAGALSADVKLPCKSPSILHREK